MREVLEGLALMIAPFAGVAVGVLLVLWILGISFADLWAFFLSLGG